MSEKTDTPTPNVEALLALVRKNNPLAAQAVDLHLASLRAQAEAGGYAFKSALLLCALDLRSEPLPE